MQYDYLLSESDRRTIDIIGREAFMDMAKTCKPHTHRT